MIARTLAGVRKSALRPAAMRARVLLPAPLSPMRPTTSPADQTPPKRRRRDRRGQQRENDRHQQQDGCRGRRSDPGGQVREHRAAHHAHENERAPERSGRNQREQAADHLDGADEPRSNEVFFLDYAEKARGLIDMPMMVTGGFRTRSISTAPPARR